MVTDPVDDLSTEKIIAKDSVETDIIVVVVLQIFRDFSTEFYSISCAGISSL